MKSIFRKLLACLTVVIFFEGCNKVELLIPDYQQLDVEGFENLVLTGRDASVSAQWNRLAAKDVDYVLVRYIDSTATGLSLQTRRYARDRQQININNLQNFRKYDFTFIVVDNYGNTSDSIVSSATPIAEIKNVFAKGGSTEGSIDIIWEDPVDPFGSFTGVYFYNEAGNLLGSAERGVESITLTGLPPGVETKIKAKVKLGADFYSQGIDFNASARVVLPPPGEVIDLAVKGKTNVLELTWEDPSDLNFDFVEIYYGEGNTADVATTLFLGPIDTLANGRRKAIIRNLINATSYAIRIKTSDAHGNASDGVTAIATPKNTVYVGNVVIGSMEDVTKFDSEITFIQGNLRIENATDLVNLNNFAALDSISGDFLYKSNSSWSYTVWDDFESLQKIGGSMTFESVWPSLNITFPLLKTVGQHFLVRYASIVSISAPALTTLGGEMYFLSASNLNTLNFPLLTRIGGRLLFAGNPVLKNLDGFGSLTHVGGDFVVGRDPWGANSSGAITSYCGVRKLMSTGFIGGSVVIQSSPFTPSRESIAAGNCSQ